MSIWTRLARPSVWKRLLVERLNEPLHLHAIAAGAAVAGGLRAKIACDLVPRPQHAWGLLAAADRARKLGLRRATVVELGVAGGVGLLNLCSIAVRVRRETGVEFRILGLDGGAGLPPPKDWRDHPELYSEGGGTMDRADLERRLPPFARLVVGDVAETVARVRDSLAPDAPLGFATVDLDYYSSTRDALALLEGPADCYLPVVPLYVDDVHEPEHNPHCGELLALREFTAAHPLRPIAPDAGLRGRRLFRNARWIDHIHNLHVLEHPKRRGGQETTAPVPPR